VGYAASPALADLDGDGDLDAAVGEIFGVLRYLANTGTLTAPAYLELTGAANPLAAIDVGFDSAPALADVDGDGDADAVVGEGGGPLAFVRSRRAIFADGFESGDASAWSLAVP
jgi:hypothetical protein